MAEKLIAVERPNIPPGSLDGATPVDQMKAIFIMLLMYQLNLSVIDLEK